MCKRWLTLGPALGLAAAWLFCCGLALGQAFKEPDILVFGSVRGAGRPLSQARIGLRPFLSPDQQGRLILKGELDPPAGAESVSDPAGSFTIAAPGSGMWRLTAEAAGYVPMEYPLAPLTDETDIPGVELPRDAGLEVIVLDERGAPVSGARVLVAPDRPRDAYTPWRSVWTPAARLGVTLENGRARFPAASGDSLRIEVGTPGFPAWVSVERQRPSLTIRLSRGIVRQCGVRDSKGRPSKDVLAWNDGANIPSGVTDDRGRISLSVSSGARPRFRFLGGGGERLTTVLPPPRRDRGVDVARLRLAPSSTVSGRILDVVRRDPIPGALVWTGRDFASSIRTDRSGGYTLILDWRDEGPLRGAAAGYFEEGSPLTVTPGGSAPGPTLALRPKAYLGGTVVDLRGKPVADVEIRTRYDPAAIRHPSTRLKESGGLSRSRRAGRFRIDNLVPGATYSLRFAKPGFAPLRLRVTTSEPGAAANPVQVVLTPGGIAFGLIHDEADRPVPGAEIELSPVPEGDLVSRIQKLKDPDPALILRAAADSRGRFELRDVPAGRYGLAVRAPGFAAGHIPGIEVPAAGERFDLGKILLVREGLVTGRVQTRDGHPIQGARVRIIPTDPLAEAVIAESGGASGDAITDAAGSFELRGQRPGDRLKLAVERSGFAPADVSSAVPTLEPLVVVLAPASRVSGRVIDEDRQPVSGVPLQAVCERMVTVGGMVANAGRLFETVSGEEGSFLFPEIEPGPVEITVSGGGWRESHLELRIFPGKDLENVEVVLRKGVTLTGRILGPDDSPVVGAEIGRSEPVRPDVMIVNAPLALSDGDGRYQIKGLAPGPLSLVASHEAFGKAVRNLVAEPGENVLDFKFQEGRTLSGRVADPDGIPVAGARIWLRPRSLNAVGPQAFSQGDGTFTFGGLALGAYELQAEKEGVGRTAKPAPVQIGESPPPDVLLELSRTGVIHGHIRGLSPDELSQVRLSVGWSLSEASRVDADGTYTISDVLPGPWRVTAQIPRQGRQAEGSVTVEAGTGEGLLDLDFAQGLRLSGTVLLQGRPVVGAAVTVLGGSGLPSWTQTDSQGGFAFQGLLEDHYRLQVSNPHSGPPQTREIDLGKDEQIVVELAAGS